MGLLTTILGFALISVCVGLAKWETETFFDEDWQTPIITGSSVFCGFSGILCVIYGIVMMSAG